MATWGVTQAWLQEMANRDMAKLWAATEPGPEQQSCPIRHTCMCRLWKWEVVKTKLFQVDSILPALQAAKLKPGAL